VNVWGDGHLMVLPQHRTWQLLQNEMERRAIIETGLRSLFYGIDPQTKESPSNINITKNIHVSIGLNLKNLGHNPLGNLKTKIFLKI
jgi:hypothetical protein